MCEESATKISEVNETNVKKNKSKAKARSTINRTDACKPNEEYDTKIEAKHPHTMQRV